MSSSQINVDTGQMLAAVQDFESAHDSIRSQVVSVQDQFNGLAATWAGDAAQGFQNAMQEWYDQCNTILQSLQGLSSDVDQSAINYDKTHHLSTDAAQALAKQIKNDPVGLPGF